MTAEQKASLGSMLGAFIGDSLGSYLEFVTGKLETTEIAKAMTMPGGGCWEV